MSYVISERQSALRKVARYNEAWTVSQTLAEFMRLEHRLASLGVGGVNVDLDDVRLRLDIMFGRLDILEEGSLRQFISTDPGHVKLLADLRDTLEFVETEIKREPLDVRPSLDRLAQLDGPMTALTSAAAEFGAARVQADQQELENLHLIYTGLAGGLIFCGILLVFLLFHHNRLLGRAHSNMEELTADLQKTTEELQAQNSKLEHVAHHDLLTGLPNRVLLRDRLEYAFLRRDDPAKGALLLLDLDGFKDVNDTLGHDVGDVLLRQVAERLRVAAGSSNVICRLGGDEFTVLGADLSHGQAEALAQRLLDVVAAPYLADDRILTIGTSIGVAHFGGANSPDQLLKHADFALYQAKATGRGTACLFHTDLHTRFQEGKAFEADLRAALRSNELQVHYQPQVNAQTHEVEGYEALLRWHHPVKGAVPPNQFIPVAEAIGMIHEIGEWVLREACKEAAGWKAALSIAVNLSPIQFRSKNLLQTVSDALAESGLPPSRLELEVTESALLDADERTTELLNSLKALGIKIAMDDFGTGYSSLGNLRRFPFDRIKIDRSFIRDMDSEPGALSIVGLIVGVARSLNMVTTAEGIETQDQLQMLTALGCDQMQGYLFGRPCPSHKLRENLSHASAEAACARA